MERAFCPDCEHYIEVALAHVGHCLLCPRCKIKLEIINTNPLELDWAYDGPQVDWDRLFDEAWF